MTFDERLNALDTSLFSAIETQSVEQDKQSWLAVQRSIRQPLGYTYLEIGSHLGGSIQQHLLDPLCKKIFSIDKRPLQQPDDRGKTYTYEGNSTARMLKNLREIKEDLTKLTCIDGGVETVWPDDITPVVDFCFIDGEHTKAAALKDFKFCLSVCSFNAVIAFHDAQVIWPAIVEALMSLKEQKVVHTCRQFGGLTFAIFLRKCKVATDPWVMENSIEGIQWLTRRANKHGLTLNL